ncbi:hypothetical protein [Phage ST231]|nr:hypothetical protein [Phage ST231]
MDLFKQKRTPSPAITGTPRKTAAEKRQEILDKIAPTDLSVLEAIEQGRLDPFLPTDETRKAFSMLKPSEQLFAAFFECPGVNQRKLSELCRHTAKMERAGLLRDLRVDRSKMAPPVSEVGFPPGVEIGPEMALAVLQCKEAMRSKK